ncbi:MAG: ABC transporter permease [Clostridia bacterium]|nr:ABC transporter permease [Clostridia bacterium]
MNVDNSSCIFKLAVKTLKKSAKRNIIAVAAIMLTTLLLTSVFSAVFSFKTASDELSYRMRGCKAIAYIDNLSDNLKDEISSDFPEEALAYETMIGEYSGQPFGNKPIVFTYMDDTSADWHYIDLSQGRLPEKDNEIAVDSAILSSLGIKEELGADVTLPYVSYMAESKGDVNYDTFKIVGIYKENTIGRCHYVCCSEDYAKQAGGIDRTNIFSIEYIEDVASYNVLPESIETYGGEDESATDFETIISILLFVAVIGFSGYLIIFNIFQISVVNDISYYGLLKTIGVTGKQLKKIIRIQSFILSAVGIPLGIILGIAVGIFTTPIILGSTILAPVADSFSMSPLIWILSAVFAFITVLISCNKPGKIAARISPVEAFRYSEVRVDNKNNKNVSGLAGMALRNMNRNKKKTILVYLSMALPIVILSLGLSFADGMSFDKFYSSDYAFKISNTDYFNCEMPDDVTGFINDFVSDSDIDNINKEFNFEESGSAYTTVGIPITDENDLAVIVGYDDSLFNKIELVEGDMAPLFEPDSNTIAVNLNGNDKQDVQVGDKVTVNYSQTECIDTRTGEILETEFDLKKTPNEFIKVENNRKQVEYEVCAIVDPSADLYIGYMLSDSYAFVLPSSKMESDTNGKIYRYLQVYNSKDTAMTEQAEKFIKEYCDNNSLAYKSDQTEREEFITLENTIRSIVIILCTVLLIIGILNFVNAVLTGILSRSHEFAVLKAIGMTDKQQKKVLVIEGYLYCLGSILMGGILYTVLQFPFVKVFEGLEYIVPEFSLTPMLLVSIVFVFLGALIPYIVYTVMARKTVVERLRTNE